MEDEEIEGKMKKKTENIFLKYVLRRIKKQHKKEETRRRTLASSTLYGG